MNTRTDDKLAIMPIPKLIANMALPPLLSMFMQYSYNLLDCIFVANIDEKALSALSLLFPLTTLMLSIAIGMGVGVNVLIAKLLGEKNVTKANHAVTSGLLLSGCISTLICILIAICYRPYIRFFTADIVIQRYAMKYMQICLFMAFPCAMHICIQKILQATGNMLSPMLFQMAGVLFNLIFDPLLIFGYLGFPKLGITGAAYATVGGYTFSLVLAVYVLTCRKQKVSIQCSGFCLQFLTMYEILVLGFPSFLMNALGAFMLYFTNCFLLAYSMTAVAFFGAYFKLQQVVIMTLNGLVQGVIPIMSYSFGAKDETRLHQSFFYACLFAACIGMSAILCIWIFPVQILRFFKASPQMLSFAVFAIKIMSLSYLFACITTIIASYLQATKRIRESLIINLARQALFLLPCMGGLSHLLGLSGIWLSFVLAELSAFALALYFIRILLISYTKNSLLKRR